MSDTVEATKKADSKKWTLGYEGKYKEVTELIAAVGYKEAERQMLEAWPRGIHQDIECYAEAGERSGAFQSLANHINPPRKTPLY